MKLFAAVVMSVFVPLFMSGCDADMHSAHEERAHAHEQHAASAASGVQLTLNDGERWMMDEHTRKSMADMEAVFAAADHSSQTSLNATGMTLSAQIEDLVVGCTMEGKAHEQLHIFLGDYIPTVNALASADNPESAHALALSIHAQFETYRKHFQ